jgi:ribosomal protein S18 acetylase RimI-like enzyme
VKILQYSKGSIIDKEPLLNLALTAFGQFSDVLTPENWSTMKSNITNNAKFTDLLEKASIHICKADDDIVGVAYLMPHGNPTALFDTSWCYIRMVGVHPDYRGRGIAKALTKICIDEAIKTNEQTIALHTSEFMDDARHIYENMGFKLLKEIGLIYGKQYWLYTLDISGGTA